MKQPGEVLEKVVAHVEQFVDPAAAAAQDVRGHTMELLALSQFHGAEHHRRVRELDIGIQKQNIGALGMSSAQVADDGRHPTADYADVEAVAKGQNNFWSAVGGVG